MSESEPTLANHEKRIYKLEQSDEDTQTSLIEVKNSLLVSQTQSSEQSKFMMSQNESLLNQNERLSVQLGNIFNTVNTTREKESERTNEMKKLSTDTRMKMLSMLIGAGSVGYLLIDTVLKMIGK